MRPWKAWSIFALFMALLLAVMNWTSLAVLRLDRMEADIRNQAELEERVRLALWRMESVLAPLIARESARPYFLYTDYTPVRPAAGQGGFMDQMVDSLLPMPQQSDASPHILLYFQLASDGTLISPQARAVQEPASNGKPTPAEDAAIKQRLASLKASLDFAKLDATLSSEDTLKVKFGAMVDQWQKLPPRKDSAYQERLNDSEWARRSAMNYNNLSQSNQISALNQAVAPPPAAQSAPPPPMEKAARPQMQGRALSTPPQTAGRAMASPRAAAIQIGLPRPLWVGDKLLLVRRATIDGRTFLQGCWLDWDVVRQMLLDEVKDLLPEGRIEPAPHASATGKERMLAALPVRLIPGGLPNSHPAGWSPLRISLMVAWGCVVLAIVAVGALLAGALALSERRRTFVSAVTHELRTPLTTFRMYTEMLAGGMVREEEKRARYLNTLRGEAERLTHLVENVLAYARLEAGRPGRRTEVLAVGDLMEKISERLAERARQGQMALEIDMADQEDVRLRVDVMAAEQILFNLVDNACKYAATGAERTIRITLAREGEALALRVHDHGPGISREEAKSLFLPFSRSARDAAGNAPGVGLGLALSRRLARAGGGELRLDARCGDGACFVLTLPVA